MRYSLWLLIGLLLAGCGVGGPAGAPTPAIALPPNVAWDSRVADGSGPGSVVTGDAAPDFVYTSADGATQTLSGLRGRMVIINFWATWCGPCREEMPALQRIADERSDVVVLGVNKLEAVEAIGPFADELGVRFALIANPSGDISERYGVRNLPTTFFLRADGTVGDWRLGGVRYDEAEEILGRLGE